MKYLLINKTSNAMCDPFDQLLPILHYP